MQTTCAELRVQFGGNNERFSDCWLSQDEGRSWSQQLETPPWAARWGMGMAALPSGALVLARGLRTSRAAEGGSLTVSSATTSCGVRSPARLDVRQSHMLFLQPDCDTVVAPVADFRSAGSMWRSTASLAALPLRAASPSARPAGERPVLASHDVVNYVWNFYSELAFVMFVTPEVRTRTGSATL